MNKQFWKNIPPWSKWDEIKEEEHQHLLHGALGDVETGIEKLPEHTYILYGEEEALLFRPKKFVSRLGIEMYLAFLILCRRD